LSEASGESQDPLIEKLVAALEPKFNGLRQEFRQEFRAAIKPLAKSEEVSTQIAGLQEGISRIEREISRIDRENEIRDKALGFPVLRTTIARQGSIRADAFGPFRKVSSDDDQGAGNSGPHPATNRSPVRPQFVPAQSGNSFDPKIETHERKTYG
jgi:hypothetical protein